MEFGELQRIDLRMGWKHEALEFTPWLAQADNLARLGDAIGMELEFQAMEESVGPFRADILCKSLHDEELVLVENQLEKTDHSHLGQIITYASALNAATVIWIAANFCEEHRAALDWLNSVSDERLKFFGIQIELWKINDSLPAPTFKIVSKPNDWKKSVKQSGFSKSSSARSEQRKKFWSQFKEYLAARQGSFQLKSEYASGHIPFSSGYDDFFYVVFVSLPKNQQGGVGIFLRISGPQSEQYFKSLEQHKVHIESSIDSGLNWRRSDWNDNWHISSFFPVDTQEEAKWPEAHEWLATMLKKFHLVFEPFIVEAVSNAAEDVASNEKE